MMVSGLIREASTIRNRNCPSVERAPAPVRSGASVPWNFCSGNGPLWQRRQSPTCRLVTILRPSTGSPLAPVSEAGMASPTTVYGRSGGSARAPFPVGAAANTAQTSAGAANRNRSAEHFRRDGPEPAIGKLCFLFPQRPGGIDGARAAGVGDLDQAAVGGLIDRRNRDPVIGRQNAVAGVDEPRLVRAAAGQEARHRGGADL